MPIQGCRRQESPAVVFLVLGLGTTPQLQPTLFPIHGASLQAGASPGLMSAAHGVAEKRGGLYPPHLRTNVLISQTKSLEKS